MTTKWKWPEICPTCGESYSLEPTFRALVCSNSFHCCRDCAWFQGQRKELCHYHAPCALGCDVARTQIDEDVTRLCYGCRQRFLYPRMLGILRGSR